MTLVSAHFVDRDDVRMVEPCGRFRLDAKPADLGLGRERPGEDHLQRHDPVQAEVTCLVNHSHPTAGQLLDEFVVSDSPDPTEVGDGGGSHVRIARGCQS